LDIAAWDISAKLRRVPLYKCWTKEFTNVPVCDYTIGIDTVEKMVAKLKEKPWPIYKIKLGTKEDIKIMQELRRHTDAVFRVDANAGWKLDEALEIIPILKDLGVELVEQPLAKDNWEEMKILFENHHFPYMPTKAVYLKKM
jgi:L-alanine-DL-glutamate epimerase-like enolase superfamily enzyme